MSEATKIELNKEEMAVIEALEKLNIVSVNNVVKYMEAEYGISAAPAMGMMMPAAGAAAGEAVEEKTAFTVQLKDAGAMKIGVIKAVRELTGLGLKEAKDIVDQNGKVMENVDKAKADEAKKALEAAGAKVELL